jgi:hypothetical protein
MFLFTIQRNNDYVTRGLETWTIGTAHDASLFRKETKKGGVLFIYLFIDYFYDALSMTKTM